MNVALFPLRVLNGFLHGAKSTRGFRWIRASASDTVAESRAGVCQRCAAKVRFGRTVWFGKRVVWPGSLKAALRRTGAWAIIFGPVRRFSRKMCHVCHRSTADLSHIYEESVSRGLIPACVRASALHRATLASRSAAGRAILIATVCRAWVWVTMTMTMTMTMTRLVIEDVLAHEEVQPRAVHLNRNHLHDTQQQRACSTHSQFVILRSGQNGSGSTTKCMFS